MRRWLFAASLLLASSWSALADGYEIFTVQKRGTSPQIYEGLVVDNLDKTHYRFFIAVNTIKNTVLQIGCAKSKLFKSKLATSNRIKTAYAIGLDGPSSSIVYIWEAIFQINVDSGEAQFCDLIHSTLSDGCIKLDYASCV